MEANIVVDAEYEVHSEAVVGGVIPGVGIGESNLGGLAPGLGTGSPGENVATGRLPEVDNHIDGILSIGTSPVRGRNLIVAGSLGVSPLSKYRSEISLSRLRCINVVAGSPPNR